MLYRLDSALPLFIGGADHEVRTKDKLVYTMSYEKEEEERSEINRDHEVVRGCIFLVSS